MRILILCLLLYLAATLCAQDSLSTYRNGDNMLFVCPTAETLPRGAMCFSSFELIFIDFSLSFVDNFEMGVFSLFPVHTKAFDFSMLHAKFRYTRSVNFSSAVFVASIPKAPAHMVGNAFSFHQDKLRIHVSPAFGFADDDSEMYFLAGLSYDVGRNSSLMGDFFTTGAALEEDVNGLMFIGMRWRGNAVQWDFGGIRPTFVDETDFLFFPYVKASWTW